MTVAATTSTLNPTNNITGGDRLTTLDQLPTQITPDNRLPPSGNRPTLPSTEGTQVAIAPALVGGGLTVGEALIIGGILGTGILAWWANENPAVIDEVAMRIKDNLDGVSATLAKVNVEYVAPSLKEIRQRVAELFANTKRGLTEAGQNIWNAPGVVKEMIQAGVGSVASPGVNNTPPPVSRSPVSSLPFVTPGQIKQTQAAQSAAATLARSNDVVQQINTGLNRYYQLAAGGRAAREDGVLRVPLESITQANRQLTELINESNSQIAASSPEAKPALLQWRNDLIQARDAVRQWLPQANAFAAGKSGPGGRVTANPTLPPPPTDVASPKNTVQNAQQVGAAIQQEYTRAANALNRSAAQPDTTQAPPPTNVSAAVKQRALNERSAAELLTRTNPVTMRMNAGVQAFYQQAAGGKAARQAGALTEPLRQVSEARSELNALISQANTKITAGTHPSLQSWRDNLVQARNAMDVWLQHAHRFAAGLGPDGQPTGRPILPTPPSFVSSPASSGQTASQRANQFDKAYNAASAALKNNVPSSGTAEGSPTPVVPNAATVLPSQIKIVSEMPASVTEVARIWVNPTTNQASATPQTGAGWVEATVGRPSQMSSGGLSGPNQTPGGSGQAGGSSGTQNYYHVEVKGDYVDNRGGGGGKPPKDPNRLLEIVISAAISGGIFAGLGAWQQRSAVEMQEAAQKEAARQQEAAQKEANWQPDTTLDHKGTPGAKVDLSSPEKKAAAIVSLWKSYFDQIPAALEKNGVSNREVVAKFKEQSEQFMQNLVATQERVKQANTPQAKLQLLEAMAAQRFPEMNFSTPGDTSAMGVRRTKTVTGLVYAMNQGAANSLATIKSVPDAEQKTSSTTHPPMSGREFFDKVLAPQIQTPEGSGNVSNPVPKPRTDPIQAPPAKDTAQSVQRKKAFDEVNAALKAAGLLSTTPQMTSEGKVQFEQDMFLNPAHRDDPAAVLAAYDKAVALFNRVKDVHTRSDRAVGLEINTQVLVPLSKVIQALSDQGNQLQKERINSAGETNGPVLAPSDQPTPQEEPLQPTP